MTRTNREVFPLRVVLLLSHVFVWRCYVLALFLCFGFSCHLMMHKTTSVQQCRPGLLGASICVSGFAWVFVGPKTDTQCCRNSTSILANASPLVSYTYGFAICCPLVFPSFKIFGFPFTIVIAGVTSWGTQWSQEAPHGTESGAARSLQRGQETPQASRKPCQGLQLLHSGMQFLHVAWLWSSALSECGAVERRQLRTFHAKT